MSVSKELAELHDAWAKKHQGKADAAFRPAPEGSDYNQHTLDVEGVADDDFSDEFIRIVRKHEPDPPGIEP